MKTKICSICRIEKPATTEFFQKNKYSHAGDGLRCACKICLHLNKDYQVKNERSNNMVLLNKHDTVKVVESGKFDERLVYTIVINDNLKLWLANHILSLGGYYANNITQFIQTRKLTNNIDYLKLEGVDLQRILSTMRHYNVQAVLPTGKNAIFLTECGLETYLICAMENSSNNNDSEFIKFCEANLLNKKKEETLMDKEFVETLEKIGQDNEVPERAKSLLETANFIEGQTKSIKPYINIIKELSNIKGENQNINNVDEWFKIIETVPKTLKEFSQILVKNKDIEKYDQKLIEIKKTIEYLLE